MQADGVVPSKTESGLGERSPGPQFIQHLVAKHKARVKDLQVVRAHVPACAPLFEQQRGRVLPGGPYLKVAPLPCIPNSRSTDPTLPSGHVRK